MFSDFFCPKLCLFDIMSGNVDSEVADNKVDTRCMLDN
jgi:hypothetical protein